VSQAGLHAGNPALPSLQYTRPSSDVGMGKKIVKVKTSMLFVLKSPFFIAMKHLLFSHMQIRNKKLQFYSAFIIGLYKGTLGYG